VYYCSGQGATLGRNLYFENWCELA